MAISIPILVENRCRIMGREAIGDWALRDWALRRFGKVYETTSQRDDQLKVDE
jgi:hypothetical protein